MAKSNTTSRITRHRRIRVKVFGIAERPRLSVFRSNNHIYAQIIDDTLGITLVSASDKDVTPPKKSRIKGATEVGKILAQKALDKKISAVVFDRGGCAYHGIVKALADGAREGGLKF